MTRLSGKVALVTGAARGIGRAIAAAFVREGAHAWVTDLDGEGAARAARELGPGATARTLDVRDEGAWSSAIDALRSRLAPGRGGEQRRDLGVRKRVRAPRPRARDARGCTAIRCNSIHPAAILTPMWEPMLGSEEPARSRNMAALVADVPLKRFGQPEEVAAIAVLLASDEATYLTGAELHVDGGILAGAVAAPSREGA